MVIYSLHSIAIDPSLVADRDEREPRNSPIGKIDLSVWCAISLTQRRMRRQIPQRRRRRVARVWTASRWRGLAMAMAMATPAGLRAYTIEKFDSDGVTMTVTVTVTIIDLILEALPALPEPPSTLKQDIYHHWRRKLQTGRAYSGAKQENSRSTTWGLGVPVGANMNLKKHWKPILDKFEAKLSPWKSKTLSFGGRLTLISSVLGNLPTYFLSLFRAPVAIAEELEKMRRRFLWGGNSDKRKIHWVSWEKVTARKSDGGLGVGSIRDLNTCLLVKWWWRLKQEKNALWAKAIRGIHNLHDKPHDHLVNKNITGVWKSIIAARRNLNAQGFELEDIFKLKVKSGENTQFWADKWLGPTSLKDKYPELFAKESRKRCTVADRFYEGEFAGHWVSQLEEGGIEISQQEALLNDLAEVTLQPGEDQWSCTIQPDGRYTVGALRHKFEDHLNLQRSLPAFKWLKTSPIKVNRFIWRAIQSRIPTATELAARGVEVPNISCSACISGSESVDHLLVSCPYAAKIRKQTFNWFGLQHRVLQSVAELISSLENWGNDVRQRRKIMLICHSMLWSIWKLRNDRLFNGVFHKIGRGVEETKSLSFYWYKHRGKNNSCSWEDWSDHPFDTITNLSLIPDEHTLLIVVQTTEFGMPAPNAACLAGA
ncbi:hypothetical protein LXL04_026973 [Taraxacum kok-saghyz]